MEQLWKRRWPDLGIALALFTTALAVYNATLTPSLSYESPDGNELITVAATLGLAHSTGYPLYTWLGKLFTFLPVGDVAHRVNLMSAVLGASSVVGLYLLLRHLTHPDRPGEAWATWTSRLASAFTALLFAFSRTFWSQTTIAEVYAPNALMVTLTLGLLLGWGRKLERGERSFLAPFVFALIFGLSLGTHMSNLGFAPAFALFVLLVGGRRLLSGRWLLAAGLGFLLGAAQFLWLPYKASTLTDRMMLRSAPNTLEGFYRYTLGAFPQFKFAFPLAAIPDRIVIYLDLLAQQYGLWGIGLGILGMWVLLFRRPRRFFLLIGMYLVHVWFFIQYRVFDLDVFFIPAHLLYALFIGVGTAWGLLRLGRWAARGGRRWALAGLLVVGMGLAVVHQVQANWAANDHSQDTAINDFYTHVWEMLPEGSVLLGRSGVFGYDMFYWRLVYHVRPDVVLPHLPTPNPRPEALANRPLYTTIRLDLPQAGRGPWALPRDLIPSDAWYIPILVGGGGAGARERPGQGLILYQVSRTPPDLVVTDAEPATRVGASLGGLTLVGYDLAETTVEPGGLLHLTLYWRMEEPGRYLIVTGLGDQTLETHELGFGNLQRYVHEHHPPRDGLIVESYTIAIPSTLESGVVPLRVGLASPWEGGSQEGIALEEVVVR